MWASMWRMHHANSDLSMTKLAHVAKAVHRGEECFKRAKSNLNWGLSRVELGRVESSPYTCDFGRMVPESGNAVGKQVE